VSWVGTNAIGVPLEVEPPRQVFAGEHFNEAV
jgi:transcriptional regulator of acetoin/glycerol metabolism